MAKHIRGGHVCMPPTKQTQQDRKKTCAIKGHRWMKCGNGLLCPRCGAMKKKEQADAEQSQT